MVVAASLIKAVTDLETERQKGGQLCLSDESVSQRWSIYGFDLSGDMVLRDPHDNSIFGAIFHRKSTGDPPPKFAIAFRGTMLRKATAMEDIVNDCDYIFNGLHESTRVDMGLTAVKILLENVSENGVWLTGHSLGAAIALTIGRTLVLSMNTYLDTYLFNPPIKSLLDCRAGVKVKNSLKSVIIARSDKKIVSMDDIVALSKWIPNLFINEFDWFCNDYVSHFEFIKKMEDSGPAGEEDWTVAMNSLRSLVSNLFGNYSQPSYLIPSAHLTINSRHPAEGSMEAHRLRQWLNSELQQLRHRRYVSFQAN
ncbi:PREDICTED: GDSL esterase/lipase At4g10955-like [Ipomoea nil]|uniref:GDSL esterase/lipase At4g10955-like n=1 Tax=Ipomoea nil TaxID=35883 RepID=UPI000901EFB3|nr:PREDICTED: GDSL esterase/lipase At4g10955-like [Ipomoea nil]